MLREKARDLKVGKTEGKDTYQSRELKTETSTSSEVDEPNTTTTTSEPTEHFTSTPNDFVLKLIFKK